MSVILRIRNRVLCAVLAAISILLCSCSEKSISPSPIYALNTVFTRTFFEYDDAFKADEQTAKILNDTEKLFSRFEEGSEVYSLNNNGSITATEDMLKILSIANEISEKSGGRYSCLLGEVSDLWDFENAVTPESSLVEAVTEKAKESTVSINGERVTLSGEGKLDLGSVVKGYAIDRLVSEYISHGVTRAVISCGSSVGVIGNATIGLRDPDGSQTDIIAKLKLKDCSISTSGDYENYFIADGNRYHHILDPQTGYPVNNSLRAVTVIGENGAVADALSTAAFVLGLDEGSKLLLKFGYEGIFITKEKNIFVTDGLNGITVTNDAYILSEVTAS